MATNNNLPYAIMHRLPHYKTFFSGAKSFFDFNPIECSDPMYPIIRPSARVVIVVGRSPLKAEHLDRYPSVECIVGTSAGVEHIDLVECRKRNVRVTSAEPAFAEDGADYAVGLFMDVLRRVSAADSPTGLFGLACGLLKAIVVLETRKAIVDLASRGQKIRSFVRNYTTYRGGKRVGIVGLGSIGSLVAKRLEPFGCTIAYTSRNKKSQVPNAFYPNVLDLATNSDSLIICCALNNTTRHIINHDVLTALGKKSVIVNIGRGALVDEKELVKFLVEGELGGAGLDVFENEPDVPQELFMLDNVVLSPHKAVLTPESFNNVREIVIANVKAFFSNKPLVSEISMYD